MAQLNNTGFDTGSNYKFGDKLIPANFPRSRIDDSCLVSTTIDNAGMVFPIRLFETLPNSDYDISVNSLIRVLPQSVPLYSRQRLYTYAFYSRCSDLWSGFQTFITKGYSGNEIKTVPTINTNNDVWAAIVRETENWSNPQFATDDTDPQVVSGSLGNMLGLPLGTHIADMPAISALPFMMYLRIWRDYFCNRNYYIDDRAILPDDDSRFRLLDNGTVASFADANKTCLFDVGGAYSAGVTTSSPRTVVPSKGMTYPFSNDNVNFVVSPFYHDYPADYFTSALPWTQRGNTPTLDHSITVDTVVNSLFSGSFNSNDFNIPNNLFGSTTTGVNDDGQSVFYGVGLGSSFGNSWSAKSPFSLLNFSNQSTNSRVLVSADLANSHSTSDADGQLTTANTAFNSWFKESARAAVNAATINGSVSNTATSTASPVAITLEELRELAIAQTIMEKMARTDGSFAEFGLTFFGEKSKAATDYRPTFIGGSYSNLVFTEVLQTSQTTNDSTLGQYAGHGIGIQNKGYLGRVHTDDYGYIMILGCIMPDVYYSQGLPKMWTRLDQSQWYLPERSELGMQPIYNQELYLQADSVVDADGNSVNGGLWAYQDIYDEYRYSDNIITGKIADPNELSFYPYTQARNFTSLPNWSQEFAEANDVRKDYLAAPIECAYSAQFDINMSVVKPIPYRARPANLLN